MDWGQSNLHDIADVAAVSGEPRTREGLGLKTVEIEDRSGTTAYHVPEGILAVYDPRDMTARTAERRGSPPWRSPRPC